MYVRITYPKIQCFDSNGDPAVGYEIHTKKAGLSTALTTYSERTLTTPNTNPVILDARGEADIYVGEAAKLIFTIPNGDIADPIWSIDYVGEQQSNFVTGLGITATTNNYTVTTTPAVAALSNNFMLIMTPDEDNVTTLTSNVFTGTGVNDCTESGAYLGAAVAVFTIQIDGVATPDTFKWKKDGGAWTTGVAITGVAQTISEGLIVTFAVTTGHTLNDIWAITVQPPARVNLDTLGNLIVYKNKGGSVVALDGADMKNGYPAQLILNEALNAWLLINPATPTFSVPTITANRYRKNITTTYSMVIGDQGYELSCVGTFTLTLLTPPEFSGKFLYIKNAGTGVITLDAVSPYKIYGNGTSTFTIESGSCFQLQTNGVDWHILSSIGFPILISQHDVSGVTSDIFTGLIPGVRYRLTGHTVQDAGVDYCWILFNADAGANYASYILDYSGTVVILSATTRVILIEEGMYTALTHDFSIDFHTYVGNDKKVKVSGYCDTIYSTQLTSVIIRAAYIGAANLTSVTFRSASGSFTGTLLLYQVG